jgi:hypothetical protein
MLMKGSGECLDKMWWLSTWVSTNGIQKEPTGAYRVDHNMASELREHHFSIFQRNSGKNF